MLCISQENIFISSWGQSPISDHCVGKKLTDALKKCLEFFNKLKKKSSNTVTWTSSSASSSTLSNMPNTDQSKLDNYVPNDVKLKTEIIWILKCLLAGYSNRSCDGRDEIFPRIFPDSTIAQKFKLGRQK